jgi:hypothetical protein
MVRHKILKNDQIRYDESIVWCQDYDLYIRIAEKAASGVVDTVTDLVSLPRCRHDPVDASSTSLGVSGPNQTKGFVLSLVPRCFDWGLISIGQRSTLSRARVQAQTETQL